MSYPRCDACGALLVAVSGADSPISLSAALRAELAAELDRAADLFAELATSIAPFRFSPRWETRARSRARLLRLPDPLDRARYAHAGKTLVDLDALRFGCWCGERERATCVRAGALAHAAPAEVRLEVLRDRRDLPKLLEVLRRNGAEKVAAAVERAAGPFWDVLPVESITLACEARDRHGQRCVMKATGHTTHRDHLGRRWEERDPRP